MANSFIILCLLIYWCFSIDPTTCSSNVTDLLALLSIKDAIHDPLGALSSWNTTSHFCSWKGIRCSHRHLERVVEINLRSQGLVGSLSPHVGNLSFLRSINLQNNTFHGQIPQEISLLRRLEYLKFSNNSFSGVIPRNISQCQNLLVLNLIDNNLSGVIPLELCFLYKLQVLGLSKNRLSGQIPPLIGNLTSLALLSLGYCNFKGEIPESLGRLESLVFLQLGGNNFTGNLPSSIFNISKLVTLGVHLNRFQGVIPSTIGFTLPNLRRLILFGNKFSGMVPMSISNVSSMEALDLSQNCFSGKMPRVGRLLNLKKFFIDQNHIEDDVSFISSMTNCTNLESIDVSENLLSGSLPGSIANLSSHLQSLYIGKTQIRGNIPPGIGTLVGLTSVDLQDNNLEGPIPWSIGKLSNLHRLYMDRNRFTGEIPSSLGNLTLLNYLYLERNKFSGNAPKSLGNCTNLLELDLSFNNLDGPIPPQIMSLSSLSISLFLSHNAFTNFIPSEVGSLTNLAYLDLSNNRLSGLIPNSLSRCISLEHLHLAGNLLEGQISSALSVLKGIQNLDLSRNNFSGTIPSFMSELHLQWLNLSFNGLEGEVPILGVFRNISGISLQGNKELCGGIPELKLPPCSSKKFEKKNETTLLKIVIPTVVAILVCLIIFLFRQRTTKRKFSSPPSLIETQFFRLSYADLLKATGGFSKTNLVGIGRFGSVYKGILNEGQTMVAVKVLNLTVKGASKSFMTECNAIRGIRHRNLLKILSVCESIDFQGNEFKSLVYEFKANGSLDKWLHPHQNAEQEEESDAEFRNLSMIQRLNIAIDVAYALEYLHCGIDSTIVHGDLKPSNILLDDDMTAHVGDFGLAKTISGIQTEQQSSNTMGIKGTIGYVPPEYGTSNLVSMQGDLYSYGILLLEIFTGRRPTDDLFGNHVNLHSFIRSALPDHVMEIVDPLIIQEGHEMDNNMAKNCVVSVLRIGVACSEDIPKDRMQMKDVVNELHKIRGYYLGKKQI